MSEVFLRPAEAMSALQQAISANDEQRQAHRADVPDFPVASAGRNFSGHGERIRSILARIHDNGTWRLDNISATGQATHDQMRAFATYDAGFSRSFAGESGKAVD